jgi:hypothetical protein
MAREVTVTTGTRGVTLAAATTRSISAARVHRFADFLSGVADGLATLTLALNRKQTLRVPVLAQAALTASLVMVRLRTMLLGIRAQSTVTAGIGGYRPVHGAVTMATWAYLYPHTIRGLVSTVAAPATFSCYQFGGLRGLTSLVTARAALAASVGGLRGASGAVTAPATLTPDLRNLGYLIDAASVRITDSAGADITVYA